MKRREAMYASSTAPRVFVAWLCCVDLLLSVIVSDFVVYVVNYKLKII